MLIIVYDAVKGKAVADGIVLSEVQAVLEDYEDFKELTGADLSVHFSTENIFLAFRLAVLKKEISNDDIVFEYSNYETGEYFKDIKIGTNGMVSFYPPGFLSLNTDICFELLQYRIQSASLTEV